MKKSYLIEIIKDALLAEKNTPGLWANINAKRKKGKKPSHGNSNAHKDAVAAGNAMKNEAAYDNTTRNELAQYIINLNNELAIAKSRGTDKEVMDLEKDIAQVKAALTAKKAVAENAVAYKDIEKEIKILQDENPKGYEAEIKRLKVRLAAFKLSKKAIKEEDIPQEWPNQISSKYNDQYIFKLVKVEPTYKDKSGRALYRVVDVATGETKGTPAFTSIEKLTAFAQDLIKPQGGTQSTNLG
jgi:hypothetical protein